MKDFRVQDMSRLNVNNGNKIVINLPKNNLVENDELIGELVEKIGQNVTQNALYLITGRHNPYNDLSDSHIEENNHFGRHILSENMEDFSEILAGGSKNTTEQLERLVAVDNCLYFYSSLFTVSHYNESISNNTIPIYAYDMKPVNTTNSKCWIVETNSTKQKEPAFLDLTYVNGTDKNSPILQLQLTIDSPFHKNKTYLNINSNLFLGNFFSLRNSYKNNEYFLYLYIFNVLFKKKKNCFLIENLIFSRLKGFLACLERQSHSHRKSGQT
jgi:hypothetical protein